jgi:hypothetical protein
MKNKKWISKNPFFVHLKKHTCPECSEFLTVEKAVKIVNSESLEAKDYDFSCGDSFLWGDVEFHYDVFFCGKCCKRFAIEYIKKIERTKKKDLQKKEKKNEKGSKVFI